MFAGPSPGVRVTDIRIDRAGVPADGRTAATITARVAADGGTVSGMAAAAYRDGVLDTSVGGAAYLADAGAGGNKTAGDGVFTSNALTASASAAPGDRTLRLIVEIKSASGKRYAVSVNAGKLRVTK